MSEFIPGTLRYVEWTPARDAELTSLWADRDITSAEIGRRMGISKNAAVGRAHRLHLPARPSPIKRAPGAVACRKAPRAPHPIAVRKNEIHFGQAPDRASSPVRVAKMRAARARPAGVSSLNSTPMPAQPLDGIGVLFGGARSDQCAWPLWDDATPREAYRVCGCKPFQRDDGSRMPYCAGHAAIAYVKPRSRAEAA